MTRGRQFLLILVAAISLILMPTAADAASLLACDESGRMVPGTELYSDSAAAGDGACEFTGLKHIASQVVCNFVVIINSVLGKVYCGIQFSITNILAAVLTLYVAIFGALLLMGQAQLNARDIIVRLFKIAAVWAFATQSAWGINIAFDFFMSIVNEGSAWVISSVDVSDPLLMDIPTDTTGGVMPTYGYIDSLIFNAVAGPFTATNSKVLGFFMAAAAVFPPLAGLALTWLLETCTLLIKTIISFMMALSAIAFLITLSPLFLSFMLFKATSHFFENWLRYMISYSLQVVLVFAIIAIWISVTVLFSNFFTQLSDMIFEVNTVSVNGATVTPEQTFILCPMVMGDPNEYGPTASCPGGVYDANTNPTGFWPFDRLNNPVHTPQADQDLQNSVFPSALASHGDIIYYLIYHLLTLIVIAFSFHKLLAQAPGIAQLLAGTGHTPALSPGWGTKFIRGRTPGGSSGNFVQNFMRTLGR